MSDEKKCDFCRTPGNKYQVYARCEGNKPIINGELWHSGMIFLCEVCDSKMNIRFPAPLSSYFSAFKSDGDI